MRFDETFDVVVTGFGLAGGIAAITAADSGARTLLIEKSEVPGGLSICSYGSVRSARDADAAYAYLKATNDGRTPDEVLRTLANGMCEVEAFVRELGRISHAVISTSVEESMKGGDDPSRRRVGANYPLPGADAFYHTTVVDVPGFDAALHYPWANGAPGGPKLFKIVHDHVLRRGVEIRLATPALRLISDPETREVCGVTITTNGAQRAIRAQRGVILACGGFEGDADMKAQFLEGKPLYNAAARTNTGDGIRMAQDLGAALWHMWHIHGAYGFRHSDPAYPYAIRLKRFPDWFPGEQAKARLKMAWILLDQDGRRFMSEYPTVHPGHRGTADAALRSGTPALPPQSRVHGLRRRRTQDVSARQGNFQRYGHPLRLER